MPLTSTPPCEEKSKVLTLSAARKFTEDYKVLSNSPASCPRLAIQREKIKGSSPFTVNIEHFTVSRREQGIFKKPRPRAQMGYRTDTGQQIRQQIPSGSLRAGDPWMQF